ncbi:MAG: hypothetical protein IJW05_01545 [Lentisphaeria bacterium]|nr:hypothetical protein [Lentisphaeria bacterium]
MILFYDDFSEYTVDLFFEDPKDPFGCSAVLPSCPPEIVEKIKDVNEAWLEDGHHPDLFIFPGHELYPQELLKEK